MGYGFIRAAEALQWANGSEQTRTYLSKINGDKPRKAQYLELYCRWAGLTPEQLIGLKMNPDPNHYVDAERLLDKFVLDDTGLPECTRWNISNAVRGFYTKNYHRLEQSGKIEYSTVKSQHTPSKRERFELYKACYTPRDKVLVLIPNCTAIALDTLHYLHFSMFEDGWVRPEVDCPHISIGSEYLKGHGKGRYKGTRQETVITPECKQVIIEYRDWYSKTFNYIWRREDHVLLDVRQHVGKPLGRNGIIAAVRDIKERANVCFGVHDGRRVVQTALENVGCPPNWIKKIKGRKVSGEESPYSKPAIEQLRAKYREALGELQFLGEGYHANDERLSQEEIKIARTIIEAVKDGKLVFKP